MVDQAVSNYVYQDLVTQLEGKSTLKYIQIQDRPKQNVHNIWNEVHPYEHDVKRAEVKARFVTETYILQTMLQNSTKLKFLIGLYANYVTRKMKSCNTLLFKN